MSWPRGVKVGNTIVGDKRLLLEADASMTTDEARRVAQEILLRCDVLDNNGRARMVDGVPREVEHV